MLNQSKLCFPKASLYSCAYIVSCTTNISKRYSTPCLFMVIFKKKDSKLEKIYQVLPRFNLLEWLWPREYSFLLSPLNPYTYTVFETLQPINSKKPFLLPIRLQKYKTQLWNQYLILLIWTHVTVSSATNDLQINYCHLCKWRKWNQNIVQHNVMHDGKTIIQQSNKLPIQQTR